MKKTIKRIFAIAVCLVLTLSFMPKFSLDVFAAASGNASYNSGDLLSGLNNTAVRVEFSKAATVEGDTITYVADRAYHSTLTDLGDVYNVTFAVIGVYLSTGISATGCGVTNAYRNDNLQISSNTSKNSSLLTVNAGGRLTGDLPEIGEEKNCTFTATISAYSVINKNLVSDGVSKTVNVKILCIDSTNLSSLVMSVSRYRSECWTPESWAAFAPVYESASAVANNANATDAQIESAAYDLALAIEGLVHNGPITECEYCLGGSTGSTSGVIIIKDVQYGSDVRNVMDIYLPQNKSGNCGLIMNIHGGAWTYGSKEYTTSSAYGDCVNYGVATAAISYRYLSSSVDGSDLMDDVQAAVAKAKEVAAQYGLNLDRLMTTGGSAGGHMAMLYAYSRASVSAVKPVCVVSLSGPTDLSNSAYWDSSISKSDMRNLLSWISGKTITGSITQNYYKNDLLNVSPINYAANAVPTVICHGMKDTTVDYSDATRLVQKLASLGKTYDFIAFPNSGHGLEADPEQSAQASQKYTEYVNTYLKDTEPTEVHRYVSNIVPKTCTSDGYTMNYCKDCGQYFVSNIVKCGHEPGEWEVATPASVEAPGLEVVRCTVCGEVVNSRIIEQLPPEEEEVTITPKDGTDVVIDEENCLILNVEQGVEDLENSIDYEGATARYVTGKNGFGTGTKVEFVSDNTGEVICTYTVVIPGDVTGDGFVDTFDIAIAGEYVNTFTAPEEIAFMKSVDIFEDDVLDASDLAFMIYTSNFEG